jgi:ABC-type sugar transport system substrate-binding protein
VPDRVVVSLPDKDNEYQHLQARDAQAAGARLGLAVEILYADNTAVQQIQQLFKSLHAAERPTAVVVEPLAVEGLERVAQKSAEAGVGWALLNARAPYLDALRAKFPQTPVFSVGSDQVEIGRMQARQVRLLLPGAGHVLYVQGPRNASAAQERQRGLQEGLAGSRVQLTSLDAGQWTEASAEQTVRAWLRLKPAESLQVDLVAAQDDSMARGARRAIESVPELAKRAGQIPFLGIDGVPEVGQRLVASRQLTATIVMPSNVGPALDALARWRKTGAPPKPSITVDVRSYPEEEELRRRAAAWRRDGGLASSG